MSLLLSFYVLKFLFLLTNSDLSSKMHICRIISYKPEYRQIWRAFLGVYIGVGVTFRETYTRFCQVCEYFCQDYRSLFPNEKWDFYNALYSLQTEVNIVVDCGWLCVALGSKTVRLMECTDQSKVLLYRRKQKISTSFCLTSFLCFLQEQPGKDAGL